MVALSLKDTAVGLAVGETKTRQCRSLVLSRTTMDVLLNHRQRQVQERGVQRLVFPDQNGGYIRRQNFNRRSFATLLAAAAKQSGLPFDGHTFHDLRHTMATLLLRKGESIVAVSRRLGHSSVTTTMNVYAHCLPQDADRLAKQFDERFGHSRTHR